MKQLQYYFPQGFTICVSCSTSYKKVHTWWSVLLPYLWWTYVVQGTLTHRHTSGTSLWYPHRCLYSSLYKLLKLAEVVLTIVVLPAVISTHVMTILVKWLMFWTTVVLGGSSAVEDTHQCPWQCTVHRRHPGACSSHRDEGTHHSSRALQEPHGQLPAVVHTIDVPLDLSSCYI